MFVIAWAIEISGELFLYCLAVKEMQKKIWGLPVTLVSLSPAGV